MCREKRKCVQFRTRRYVYVGCAQILVATLTDSLLTKDAKMRISNTVQQNYESCDFTTDSHVTLLIVTCSQVLCMYLVSC